MKITYTGNHRTARDPRAKSADRFGQRRSTEERRSGAHVQPEDERRAASRRGGERREEDVTSFPREAERRLIKILDDPVQCDLLRKGRLKCPSCNGQIRAKSPTKWASRVIWEIRCRDCARCMVHETS